MSRPSDPSDPALPIVFMFWRCPHCGSELSYPREGLLFEVGEGMVNAHLHLRHGYSEQPEGVQ